MSGVRVLVGTRKGAFILTADGKRERWNIAGPHFGGWELFHLKGSPADPNRLYASQGTSWFGQLIQKSSDGGTTWEPVGNKFVYDGVPGTHQWYDGTPHPWEFKRVWHLEPSLDDPDTIYAGVEDAALFKSVDAGQTWQELPGLRTHGSGPRWAPGAVHSRSPWRPGRRARSRSPAQARYPPPRRRRSVLPAGHAGRSETRLAPPSGASLMDITNRTSMFRGLTAPHVVPAPLR